MNMSDFIYNGGVITMGKMYKIRQVFWESSI